MYSVYIRNRNLFGSHAMDENSLAVIYYMHIDRLISDDRI